MDGCGRCKSSNPRSLILDKVANFRKKRDLSGTMKGAVANSDEMSTKECPCPIGEEKDACGICNPKKRKGTSSHGKSSKQWSNMPHPTL